MMCDTKFRMVSLSLLATLIVLTGWTSSRAIPTTGRAVAVEERATGASVEPEWVIRSRLIDDLDLAALHFAAVGWHEQPRIDMPLFGDTTLTLEIRDASFRDANRFTVVGVVPRAIGSNVTISVCNDAVYGVITVPRMGTYEIRYAGNGWHLVRHFDTDLMPGCGIGPGQFIAAPPADESREDAPLDGAPLGGEPAVIDVLVAYTPAALNAAGGESGMLAMIDTAMSQTNQAFVNGEAGDVTVELSMTYEVDYEEDDDMSVDLQLLSSHNDGYMDEVHDLRDEDCGSDLVALLTYSPDSAYCGVAWAPGSPIGDSPNYWSNFGFSVTRIDCIANHTFPHELGHNLGCVHALGDPGGTGSFPHARGYRFFGDSGSQWRTVMAYPPGARILNFSNPTVFHDGQPTGSPAGESGAADCALAIDVNSVAVAGYRNCPPETPPNPVITSVTCEGALLSWPDGAAPPDGVKWHWQGTSCGTYIGNGHESTFLATESGVHRLRARNDSFEWGESCAWVGVNVPEIPPDPPDPVFAGSECGGVTLSWPDGSQPPAGVSWYWQKGPYGECGYDTSLGSESPINITTSGTYYLRARHDDSDCWSKECGFVSVNLPNGGYWDNALGQPGATGYNASVEVMTYYDNALVVAGRFTELDGIPLSNIARWDGSSWSPLGTGLDAYVNSVIEFDDGSGTALYVAGVFSEAGGQPASYIARWDGAEWSPLGSGLDGTVHALAVFDDGTGPALYAGGHFDNAGGKSAPNIARWDGAEWSSVGTGMNLFVNALYVFDDGSGPALYAGGSFTEAGGQTANRIARWDGAEWSPLGSGTSGAVYSMVAFDDGSGPTLYVGGSFSHAGEIFTGLVARWDGAEWSAMNDKLGTGSGFRARRLSVIQEGSGPVLYVGGRFSPGSYNHIARGDGQYWQPLGEGIQHNVPGEQPHPFVLAILGGSDGDDHTVYIGGKFSHAGQLPAVHLATWHPCTPPLQCPGDLTGDGSVDGADLSILLANWGQCNDCDDCVGDLNDDCHVEGADLGTLLANWGECPP